MKKAFRVVGLQHQHADARVWVLNDRIHIDEDGQLIQPEKSTYVWVAKYLPSTTLSSLGIPDNDTASTVSARKFSRRGLKKLIDALQTVYERNFHAAIINEGGKVPAAIATGDVSLGNQYN